jgi:hypothetical protein
VLLSLGLRGVAPGATAIGLADLFFDDANGAPFAVAAFEGRLP